MPEPPAAQDIPVLHLPTIDSTNLLARRMFERGELGDRPLLIVADEQSGGIGRFGRPWQSPRGGLWCTLAWPLGADENLDLVLDGLGLRVGLAAVRTIREMLDAHEGVRLKWPNDVLIDGRKVCGVLCEFARAGEGKRERRALVIGVGINANNSAAGLDESLRDRSTSLADHGGAPVNLDDLRNRLLRELIDALATPGLSEERLAEARAGLHGLGETMLFTLPDGSRMTGTLRGLDDLGMARVETADGLVSLPSGTIVTP